jgi:hypothetical protein
MQQSEDAHSAVHEGHWKLVAHGDAFAEDSAAPVEYELYDLASDPREEKNVADRNPEVVKRLQKQLREFGALQHPGVGAFGEGKKGFKAPKDWVLPE